MIESSWEGSKGSWDGSIYLAGKKGGKIYDYIFIQINVITFICCMLADYTAIQNLSLSVLLQEERKGRFCFHIRVVHALS